MTFAIPDDALVLLVGPAASGKSTWAASHFRPSQVVSSDALRELVADDASDQAASGDAFRLLHLVTRARLRRGLPTVVDATNLRRTARKPLLALAAELGRPSVAVVFDVPLEVLLERNVRRARTVPEDVVRRHYTLLSAALDDIPGEGYQLVLRPGRGIGTLDARSANLAALIASAADRRETAGNRCHRAGEVRMMSWHRRAVALIATVALLVPWIGVSPAAAESPAHLSVTLGSNCMSGIKPSDDKLTVKLRRADGTLLDTYSDAAPSPFVYPCFSKRIRAGYRLRLIWAGHVREVRVPDLTIAADRITDVVSGHGPASRHITVKFSDCSLSGCAGYTELDRVVDGHGHWHKDLTSMLDLQGADRLAASYANGSGDTFTTPEGHVPYLRLSKPNKVHVECQPDRTVHVTLKTAGGSLRASTTSGPAGGCAARDATFRKGGAPVSISVGNIIRSDLASDAKVVWPHLAVSWTGSAVSARCLPSAPTVVRVVRSGTQAFLFSAATDPGGHLDYGATGFTSASGDVLELTCATPKGDRVTFTGTVP